MEPVVLPKSISPVARADRIKRAKPRQDADGGSPFGRYRRPLEETAGTAAVSADEDPDDAVEPRGPKALAERDDHPARKAIDIRV